MINNERTTRSKNNLAETGLGRFIFLIKFTVNRQGKQLRAKLFLLPPLGAFKEIVEIQENYE